MHLIIGLLLSSAIGVSLGLIGGGGSIITVPVLVYVLGVDAHEAVAMSLAVVGATSIVGAWLHSRRGVVRVRTGLLFASTGIAGALGGAQLTYLVSPSVLMLSFAALMLAVAASMLIRRKSGEASELRRETHVVRAAGAAPDRAASTTTTRSAASQRSARLVMSPRASRTSTPERPESRRAVSRPAASSRLSSLPAPMTSSFAPLTAGRPSA